MACRAAPPNPPVLNESEMPESTTDGFSTFGGQAPEDQHNMACAEPPATLQRPQTSLSPSPMSFIPSIQPFPGTVNFQFEFGKQPKVTKSVAWTYSSVTNKLYAQKDLPCPVRFKIDADGMANQLFVRALPVYSQPEYLQEVVKRCPKHIQAPDSANIPHREHFIWCENQGATYIKDPHTGRHAVRVPYDTPPADTPWVTFLYSFKCLNSCVCKTNGREVSIVYTLENANQEVLGRACIGLRVCASPGRDRKSDESKAENRNQSAASTPTASTHTDAPPTNTNAGGQMVSVLGRDFLMVNKKPRVEPPCEMFVLIINGRRNFELLSEIRDSLEMSQQLVHDNERDRFIVCPNTFMRCSMKRTVTSKGNKKRSAESSTSEAESLSNEEYQSKKHRALKRDSNSQ